MPWTYAENIPQRFSEGTLLGEVTSATLTALNSAWTVSHYECGALILDDEEQTDDVFFLLLGHARAGTYADAGREVMLVDLHRGDCFGEFSAIDGAPRSARITALQRCAVARISAAEFRKLLRRRSDLSHALHRLLVRKLRCLTRRISELHILSAGERIRREIFRLAELNSDTHGGALLASPPTQADLAAFVFTNRESVAREMGRMKRQGVLVREGRSLRVPSLRRLAEYALGDNG
ncbi:MAG: Crp/Fnr family transcriptional regulator [Paracoccaceae bacterium]